MIYHLSFPHSPFLKYFIEPFETLYPGENRILLITNPTNQDNRCNVADNLIAYKGSSKDKIVEIVNKNNKVGVCIYWLNDDIIDIVGRLEKNIKIYFRSYGPDINAVLYRNNYKFCKPETKKILQKYDKNNALKQKLYPVYEKFLKPFLKKRSSSKYLPFLKRIDAIGTVTRYEYKMLKKRIPDFTDTYILTAGYKNSDNISDKLFDRVNRKIQIGHSGFAINNHADVFKKISSFNRINDLKIIAPLNYGNQEYVQKIKTLGEDFFQHQFHPITEYLEINEYYKIIDSCETLILNNFIQQGGGNVYHYLLNGGKVYLDENNPIYKDAKKDGLILFSVQKDLNEEHLYYHHLSLQEKEFNRSIILKTIYNKEIINSRTRQIYELLHK